MAVRQHILPRFLIKGFASRDDGKNIYTWVYRKGGKIFETNIINVSVEKFFYGEDGAESVDEAITDLEYNFSLLLNDLREMKESQEINDERIAEFITHLVVRTKHLRESVLEPSQYFLDKVIEYYSDMNNIKSFLLKNPDRVIEPILKELGKHQLAGVQKKQARAILTLMLPAILEGKKDEFKALVDGLFSELRSAFPEMVKKGHISALAKRLIPEPRVEDHKALRWYLIKTKSTLILGDIGCLFETSGDKKYNSITLEDDKIINLFLPISYKQILVGTSLTSFPRVDPKIINAEVVKASREFFVSHQKIAEAALLLTTIGEEAELVSKERLGKIAEELFKKKMLK